MDSTYERTDGNSGREHLDGIGIQLVEDTREDGLSKAEEEIASALSLPEYPTANEQKRQIGERVAAFMPGRSRFRKVLWMIFYVREETGQEASCVSSIIL